MEQYILTNRESVIKAHAEDYSWNIESELFQQLTQEQQKLWRKEIEQAVISGGYSGLNLAKDPCYKESLEEKDVDLDKEAEWIANGIMIAVQSAKLHTNVYNPDRKDYNHSHLMQAARRGIELGLRISYKRE